MSENDFLNSDLMIEEEDVTQDEIQEDQKDEQEEVPNSQDETEAGEQDVDDRTCASSRKKRTLLASLFGTEEDMWDMILQTSGLRKLGDPEKLDPMCNQQEFLKTMKTIEATILMGLHFQNLVRQKQHLRTYSEINQSVALLAINLGHTSKTCQPPRL
jgi:hypothetical protein